MRALLAALLTAATLPVLPAADASKLVADVAGKPARGPWINGLIQGIDQQ